MAALAAQLLCGAAGKFADRFTQVRRRGHGVTE